MDNAHICQLHYKIAWVHHEKPNFYKSIYAVLKILDKEPHLLKCGSRHAGSTSINVLNDTLISMVTLVWLLHVKWLLPASDLHLNVWKVILKSPGKFLLHKFSLQSCQPSLFGRETPCFESSLPVSLFQEKSPCF